MARRKQVNLSLSQAILRRLLPEITSNGKLSVALIVSILKFHRHLHEQFMAEFTERDYVQWDDFASWMRLQDLLK
jgi:hypothetical protein